MRRWASTKQTVNSVQLPYGNCGSAVRVSRLETYTYQRGCFLEEEAHFFQHASWAPAVCHEICRATINRKAPAVEGSLTPGCCACGEGGAGELPGVPPAGAALAALACSFSSVSLSFLRRPENHTCSRPHINALSECHMQSHGSSLALHTVDKAVSLIQEDRF